ncbi:hypothetical protein JNUCC64_13540 [Streptomyces sp. JNUCC 64]
MGEPTERASVVTEDLGDLVREEAEDLAADLADQESEESWEAVSDDVGSWADQHWDDMAEELSPDAGGAGTSWFGDDGTARDEFDTAFREHFED